MSDTVRRRKTRPSDKKQIPHRQVWEQHVSENQRIAALREKANKRQQQPLPTETE